MTHLRLRCLATLWLLILPVHGAGQTTEPIYTVYRAPVSDSGARATGMGGAFVGLADDATAITMNPAGLSTLTRSQLGIAARGEFNSRGVDLPRAGGVVLRSSPISPSLFVAVLPTSHRLSIGGFVKSNGGGDISFQPMNGAATGLSARWQQSKSAIGDRTFGFATAVVLTPVLAIGAGVATRRIDAAAHSRIIVGTDSSTPVVQDFSLIDAGNGVEWSVGGLARLTSRWTAGAAYQSGSVVSLTGDLATGANTETPRDVDFASPSQFSVGTAFRWNLLSVSFEARHVKYSDLVTSRFLVFESLTDSRAPSASDFSLPDFTSVRGGVEYFMNVSTQPYFVLRAGGFSQPSDRFQVGGGNGDRILALDSSTARRWGLTQGLSLVFSLRFETTVAFVETGRSVETTVHLIVRL